MVARTCSTRGCPHVATYRGRCPGCAQEHEQHQRTTVPTKMVRTHAERIRRAGVVREHRARHGDWCPGYGVPPHQAADLTADDLVPVAASGRPSAVLVVLCRSCNSRKGTAEGHAE